MLIGAVCVRPASRQELWDSAVEALQRTGKIVVDIHWAIKPNLPYYTELGSKNCDVTRPG